MNFGESLLKKLGWKEGESLGKNNTGIKEPIKPHRKTDTSGLGSNVANEITGGNWWERVFNEAASNLNVETSGGAIKVTQKDKEGVEITNKGYSVKKLLQKKDVQFGFLKAATLDVGKETELEERTKLEDIEVKQVKALTDEELFKACGGLTAHKGARHGLTLGGKLSRMEAQDRKLMERLEQNGAEIGVFGKEWVQAKGKNTRKSQDLRQIANSDSEDELKEVLSLADYSRHSKKVRKKHQRTAKELSEDIEKAFCGLSSTNQEEKAPQEDEDLEKISEESKAIKKKKKKKDRKSKEVKDFLTHAALEMIKDLKDEEPALVEPSKKKKKKKDKEPAPVSAEDFLKVKPQVPKATKKRKLERLQSASEASEDEDIERVNEDRSHLRHKRKIKREDVFDSEFQRLHKEVAEEKGVDAEKVQRKMSKAERKRAKKETQKRLEKIEL